MSTVVFAYLYDLPWWLLLIESFVLCEHKTFVWETWYGVSLGSGDTFISLSGENFVLRKKHLDKQTCRAYRYWPYFSNLIGILTSKYLHKNYLFSLEVTKLHQIKKQPMSQLESRNKPWPSCWPRWRGTASILFCLLVSSSHRWPCATSLKK